MQRERKARSTQTDITAREFMRTLAWLRLVFLEDSAVLQDKYPKLVIFKKHQAFKHALWCALQPTPEVVFKTLVSEV